MDTFEMLELGALIGAIAIFAYGVVSMIAAKDRLDPADGDPENEGFGRVSRPQRVVNGAGLVLPFALVWLMFALIGITAGLLVMDRFLVPSWLGLLIALLVTYILWNILRAIARRRAIRFEEKLIDGIDMMINVLQCGETPRRALEGVAKNGEHPVRGQFVSLMRRLEFGTPVHRALRPIVRGYDSEGVRLFASTIAAKLSLGGDMVPILTSLNRVLRDRHRHRVRVTNQLSGSKLASWVIAIGPYFIFAFYVFQKPEWVDRIFNTSIGTTLFVGAVCLQVLGIVWMSRLVRAEQ